MRSFSTEISGNRGAGDKLSSATRSSIISKHEAGVTNKDLAAEYGVHRNTISSTIKRWTDHHTLESLPRSGRPEITTRREKRMLVRMARRYPKIKYIMLMEEAGLLRGHYTPSRRTITRLLKRAGLTNHRCAMRPKFNARVAALRLRFGREHRHFNWRRRVVKFTDECSVQRGLGEKAEWCF
jgi:transposase